MDVVGIGNDSGSANLRRSLVQQEDFLQVLLAQLRYQDPLKPMDNSEFIAQFAQLTNLEQTQQMNEKLDTLLDFESGSQAIDLLGKTIEATVSAGNVVGEVTTVAFQAGNPTMTIKLANGQSLNDITLGQVKVVR